MLMTTLDTGGNIIKPHLQLLAWEVTHCCNLSCAHCRASAITGRPQGELSTSECINVIDQVLEAGKPIIILTGGEPLLREDFFDIANYAACKGLRVVMGSNGTLITQEIARLLKSVPVSRVSVSLDFPSPELQDSFRGQDGAFEAALKGIRNLRSAGIDVQVNSTLTKMNIAYLGKLLALALQEGAVAFHPFFLVATGRGKGLRAEELSPAEYEDALNWIYDKQVELGNRLFLKPTDAPHYFRVMRQRNKQVGSIDVHPVPVHGPHGSGQSLTRGCMAGTGFCFISHTGKVQGCGYLEVEAGDLRRQTFKEIWYGSHLFTSLRDLSNLKGKCGMCEYKKVCGGCRARAYEAAGDCQQEEPYCIYQPPSWGGTPHNA